MCFVALGLAFDPTCLEPLQDVTPTKSEFEETTIPKTNLMGDHHAGAVIQPHRDSHIMPPSAKASRRLYLYSKPAPSQKLLQSCPDSRFRLHPHNLARGGCEFSPVESQNRPASVSFLERKSHRPNSRFPHAHNKAMLAAITAMWHIADAAHRLPS
jgi:hypothetical protein